MSFFSNTDVYDIKDSTEGLRVNKNEVRESKLSILLQKGDHSDESMDFLSNILKAIGFDINTDCTVRIFDEDELVSLSKVLFLDKSKYILSFGIATSQFDSQATIAKDRWNHFDSFSLIVSNKLDDIKNNINLKRNLWVELKKVFNG